MWVWHIWWWWWVRGWWGWDGVCRVCAHVAGPCTRIAGWQPYGVNASVQRRPKQLTEQHGTQELKDGGHHHRLPVLEPLGADGRAEGIGLKGGRSGGSLQEGATEGGRAWLWTSQDAGAGAQPGPQSSVCTRRWRHPPGRWRRCHSSPQTPQSPTLQTPRYTAKGQGGQRGAGWCGVVLGAGARGAHSGNITRCAHR